MTFLYDQPEKIGIINDEESVKSKLIENETLVGKIHSLPRNN